MILIKIVIVYVNITKCDFIKIWHHIETKY